MLNSPLTCAQLLNDDCVRLEQLVHTYQLKHLASAERTADLFYSFNTHNSGRDATNVCFFTSFSTPPCESVVFGTLMYRNAVICP